MCFQGEARLILALMGEGGRLIFLNGIAQGCHHSHIRIHPWTMFFNGIRASSKPTVAPPKKAMRADSLELLPSQMASSADRTVFYIVAPHTKALIFLA
jgi:hypothetical protein